MEALREVKRAGDAEAVITQSVTDEASRAQVAEGAITDAVAAEVTDRKNAVTGVSTLLAIEKSARESEDANLSQRISDTTARLTVPTSPSAIVSRP